jgi:CubicO group peptidase (beta-lactamase class C family)
VVFSFRLVLISLIFPLSKYLVGFCNQLSIMKLSSFYLSLLCVTSFSLFAQQPKPFFAVELKPYAAANVKYASMDVERLNRIDGLVKQYVDSQWIAGATIIAARNGQIVYQKAIGYADVSKKTPLTNESIFRIASQTKAITSVAVMMLFEEGKFLLDDPISRYIPAFAKPQVLDKFNPADSSYTTVPAKSEITIRQLLTHTSGISYAQIGTKEANAIYGKADITAGIGVATGRMLAPDMLKLAKLPLMHQPGEKFTYGLNTDVLGYLVEVVSGKTLDQFFRERILDPLEMNDTWFYLPENKQKRLVTLHTEDSLKKVTAAGESINRNGAWISNYPNTKGTYFSGGAGLSSTAYDYAIFMEMMRNGGIYKGKRILSRNSVDMMIQNQIGAVDRGPNEKFGLGFGIITEQGSTRLGLSTGTYSWGGAFSSTYWIDPKEKIVAQVFINQSPISKGDIHDKIKVLLYSAILE